MHVAIFVCVLQYSKYSNNSDLIIPDFFFFFWHENENYKFLHVNSDRLYLCHDFQKNFYFVVKT